MASRRRSRELAFQMVFQWDLHPSSLEDANVINVFWKEQAQSSDDNRGHFEVLVRGVAANLPKIDKSLESVLKNWKMSRVDKVDLAVLRIATYELLFQSPDDRPDRAVVINEAVEISRKFGNKGSPQFVNGILDALHEPTN